MVKDKPTGQDSAGMTRLLRELLIASEDESRLDAARGLAQSEGIDWDLFTRLALHERVDPLLYSVVKDRQIVPLPVEEELRNSYLYTAKRNMILFTELEHVLERLSSAGVDVIVLKGAALIEEVYTNVALRIMRDIDILVRRERAGLALQALADLGYSHDAETRAGASIAYENEAALRKQSLEPAYLEVHWSLFNSPFYQDLPLDWFWETAVVTPAASGAMNILSPEAQLLYYCGHIQLHHAHETHLLWLYDLKKVIEGSADRLDWPLIVDKAREHYLVLPLRKTLSELASDWNAPVPRAVLAELQAADVSEKEAQVFALLTARERPVAQRFLADLRMMASWRRRLGYAWINLFPAPAYMYDRYGFSSALQLPIYYAYRFYLGARSVLGR